MPQPWSRAARNLMILPLLVGLPACVAQSVHIELPDRAALEESGNRVTVHGAITVPAAPVDGHPVVELSALAWDDDESVLYALSDRGVLFWLR
ncbi:MAG: hypothetical protein ACFCUJ_05700, partial [Thiotrichales bacterium]